MSHLQIVKGAVHIASMLGVTKVVTDVIRTNTIVLTTVDKILVNTGSLVLGSMIGEAASTHVTQQLAKLDKYRVTVEETDETETEEK